MKKTMRNTVLFSLLILSFIRCVDDRDALFERPSWLEPPIYTVLQEEGRFTKYLQCVDSTMYASTLKGGGLYTVFAPNDSAFEQFFASSNGLYSRVEDLPTSLKNQIVSYSMVYNNYPLARLTDVRNSGWDTLSSIKKKTTYYETIHQEEYKGETIWVYDMPTFNSGDQNYKYLPFYLTPMFERFRSNAEAVFDYGIMYPNSIYTGRNVQNASILAADKTCENGVVHEVDQVILPLPTLEKMLKDSNYSEFDSLLHMTGATGEPYYITYSYNKDLTKFFQEAMPDKNIQEVYLKSYSGLPFNLNTERYGTSQAQAEKGGFTLYAPNNEAVRRFYNEKLSPYYPGGLTELRKVASKDVINYFLNAQLSEEMIWPNGYKGGMNTQGEYLNGIGARGKDFTPSDYTKIAPASNGLFYGSKDYIKSRYFETVFTEILLNPKYNLFNTAFTEFFEVTLKEELLRCALNGYTQENYTVLMPSDSLLRAEGFDYQWLSGSNKFGFVHSKSGSSLGNFDVNTRIQRLVKSHIFKRLKNEQVDCAITSFTTKPDFATAYGGYSYAVNEYGDMIRYKDGKIQMVGNYDDNRWVTATPYKTFSNGQVFTIDQMLEYSKKASNPNTPAGYKGRDLILYILEMSAATQNPNIQIFKNYLSQCLKGDESNELAGISADMVLTVLMPTNAQMTAAQNAGDLPKYTDVSGGNVAARLKATQFILHHIIKGKVFVDDGLPYIMPNKEVVTEEVWPTVLKDVVDPTYLAVRKDETGRLVISTQVLSTGRALAPKIKTAKVTRGVKRSNYFGPKAVLHEIDGYLPY